MYTTLSDAYNKALLPPLPLDGTTTTSGGDGSGRGEEER